MNPHLSDDAARLAERWNFLPTEQLESGWCSHVYADETRVLKAPWRGEEMTSGLRASLAMQSWFGPEILHHDPQTGTVLMDRIIPGYNLTEYPTSDLDRMSIVADLIEILQNSRLDGHWIELDTYHLLDHPLKTFLMESTGQKVFLHADLHHFNLLWSEKDSKWIPIDPKGLVGEPCYEVIAYLRNEIPERNSLEFTREFIGHRLDYFAKRLNFDRARIAAWGWIDQIDSGSDANLVLAQYYEEVVLQDDLVDASFFEHPIKLPPSTHVDGDSN